MTNQKLRDARANADMTQEAVARAANIPVRLYQRYEYGDVAPGVKAAIRLAKALHCRVEDIFGEETHHGKETV